MSWAVITDLDGTLLDHETYSWEGAEPALDLLRQRGIPVVLCTSKTWAETRRLAERMGISGPAIVENGSAVRFGDERVVLGTPRARVLEAFREMQAVCQDLRGMSDMDVDEVARRTGLPREVAAVIAALRREG